VANPSTPIYFFHTKMRNKENKNMFIKAFDELMMLERTKRFPNKIIKKWIEELNEYLRVEVSIRHAMVPCPCVRFDIWPKSPECLCEALPRPESNTRDWCLRLCKRAKIYGVIRDAFAEPVPETSVKVKRTVANYIISQLQALL